MSFPGTASGPSGRDCRLDEAAPPLRLTVGGERVTVVNFSEGEDLTASTGGPGVCGWEIEPAGRARPQGQEAGRFRHRRRPRRTRICPLPAAYVVEAFRALSDAGADCVVGHHPHVPQGSEMRRGRLIAYSLGNFAFFQPPELYYRRTGFCLSLEVRAGRLASHDSIPIGSPNGAPGARRARERPVPAGRSRRVSRPLRRERGSAEAWQAYLASLRARGLQGTRSWASSTGWRRSPARARPCSATGITTLQHAELWRDALTRFMSEKPAPAAAGLDHGSSRMARREPSTAPSIDPAIRPARSAARPNRRSPR